MSAMKNDLTPNLQPPTSYAGFPCSVFREPCSGNWYVDQRRTGWDAMFTFSGKERDEETGYGYFGARYYDSDISIWLSVDPLADKYPSLSPYVYCANNPVKLVDPDGREIVISGSDEYKAKIQGYLDGLIASGRAGKRLVNDAIKSKRTFVIADIEGAKGDIASNGKDVTILGFDANLASGTYDADNGGGEYNGMTKMAHELAHFNNPMRGTLLNDKGQNTNISASEVGAVEWENRVRKDLGMEVRKKYAGINVYGKGITESSKYPGFYNLTTKSDYAGSNFSSPSSVNYNSSSEPRGNYHLHGKYLDVRLRKPLNSRQQRLK